MKHLLSMYLLPLILFSFAGNEPALPGKNIRFANSTTATLEEAGQWSGTFSNGMKGNTLRFAVKNGEVKGLTFKGYWYCDRKLEQTTLGPEKGFTIRGNKVDGVLKESGFSFELHGTFNGNKASGTLRIAFVAGGCDTYSLNWTAVQK